MHIIKVDSMGNFMWSKLYGSTGNDAGAGIALTPDGGYILSGLGMYNSNQQWMDGAIRRIDATGNLIWEKLIGNINKNGFDWVYSLSDGNYAVIGSYRDTINPSAVNAWLVKFDINGNIHWQRFYNKYGGNNHNYFRDLKETPDKGFVIIGELTNLSLWQQNMWLIKLDSLGCDVANCSVGITEEMPNEFVFTLYPNPAQDVLHIETTYNKEQTILYIYDITGKEIRQTSIKSNYQQLNISTLPAGLYLCRLTQGDFNIKTIKLLKQ
ncbi:MAG: T9SS type A sorting domain-containing protein [Flavobacteriales bacterium]|nr:T9SS type A sorting domain-containing protein [Flavobacteriales bacterium]